MRLDRELACQDVVELVTAYLDDALLPDDRERFVATGRIPIAGFAAARAAEWRDGPGAYDEERQAQAGWLAERLGLAE